MNNLILSELKTVQRKLTLLLTEHKKVKQELLLAKQENQELKKTLDQKQETLANFQNRHKMAKLADNLGVEETDNTELKQLLNQYILEIDKCILQLGE